MVHLTTGRAAAQLETLFDTGSVAGLSDRQLLERYLASARDLAGEAAFAAIVSRHGPMVMGICRQILGDAQDAEDTFEAVFLVLARKASSIRDPDVLSNWLHGVGLRTARCARRRIGRRRVREQGDAMKSRKQTTAGGLLPSAEPTAPPADLAVIDREQAEAIHAEVDRLPQTFRLPIVLCCFEGLTLDEAARRLRCPAGTLHSRSMLLPKLRFLVSALLLFGAVATGGATLWKNRSTMNDELAQTTPAQKPRDTPKLDNAVPKPAAGRMFVVGRVLDPRGTPLPGATVMTSARSRITGRIASAETLIPTVAGNTDATGRFRLDVPRIRKVGGRWTGDCPARAVRDCKRAAGRSHESAHCRLPQPVSDFHDPDTRRRRGRPAKQPCLGG